MNKQIVLSPKEETSISLDGDFKKNPYSKNLKLSLLQALDSLKINVISKIEVKTTQDNSMPKLFLGQYSDWHNGYFIAVCKKENLEK